MTASAPRPEHGRRLWAPDPARAPSRMTLFRQWAASTHGCDLDDYAALHRWSVENPARFWEALYRYFGIESPTPYTAVMSDSPMWDVRWFEGASVNYAQNILRALRDDPDRTAIVTGNEAGEMHHVSRAELLRDVAAFGAYLTHIGIGKGSRVAAYVSSNAESVTAFLACAAVGAVLSSVSPDFGTEAVCDRLEQFAPHLLIATDGYVFGGRSFGRVAEVDAILGRIGSIERVVHMPSAIVPTGWSGFARPTVAWDSALRQGRDLPFAFARVDFDHPLITCFSSGTTGKPKGIVHGHGGVTLEAFKMTALQGDMGDDDVCTMFSTAGWIVWFMHISALSMGTTIGLFDGNPLAREGNALWNFVARSRTSFLTISSAFLTGRMQAAARPNADHDLSALRTVVFGASPATPEAMAWVADHVGHGVQVATASGGTEIFTCFLGYCPDVSSYAGEFQCAWLGTDAVAMGHDGAILHGEIGELVIRQPMPTMPIHFLDDPGKERLRATYFEDFPGLWWHGDLFVTLDDGTSRILGRSDATLNRGGVRIGTAEIYDIVDRHAAIEDSLVVNIDRADGTSRMWLFLLMAEGRKLTAEVRDELAKSLRALASPRHVPDEMHAVPSIPYNITGKKLEVPVKRLLMGADEASVVNRAIMRDPAAIDAFIDLAVANR
ncbi:acetoacetate--CoA ligase [Sphingopyxis alaskensis]|uniref:acetoacetate--CoA ligase n=1 Tax=Sphingopyxis alaskensis TaxID=117207 RepID=UPI00391AFDB5